MTTIQATCPVCRTNDTVEFVHREAVPVHQNLLYETAQAAQAAVRGTLSLYACRNCDFVFNAAFDPSLMSYSERYDNAQEHSGVFERHVDMLARRLIEDRGIRGMHVVEVGCGQGSFLRRLVEYPGSGNTGTGYDPSYAGPPASADGRLKFRREFYGADSARPDSPVGDAAGNPAGANHSADAVVARHVIEHVPDPVAMLRSLRSALSGSMHTQVFFETPCIEWIFREQASWDLFYEHCSLFNPRSLAHAFSMAGFKARSVEHVFGGQYLWLEGRPVDFEDAGLLRPGQTALVESALAFGRSEVARIEAITEGIARLGATGRVALWGAGAKGCTLTALVDPDASRIDSLIDINPGKQGCFVAATGHPILAPAQAFARGVRSALLMNPNYLNECRALLARDRVDIQLLELD